MTTTAEVIAETETIVLGGLRDEINVLASTVDSDDTSVAVSDALAGIKAGSVLSIGLEDMYVRSVVDSTKTATVIRGWNGTNTAAHTSGAIVYVNARSSKGLILQAVNRTLRWASSNGLYRHRYVDLTYSSSVQAYDFTGTDIIGQPFKLQYKQSGSSKNWPEIKKWRFDTNVDTTVFASGMAVTLFEGAESGNPIRVHYRAPFTALSTLADNVASVAFLPEYAHNILAPGAAVDLLRGRMVQRADLFSQGDSRRADEVGTQEILQAIANLRFERDRALALAVERMSAENPTRL